MTNSPFGVLGNNLLAKVEGEDVLEYEFTWSGEKVTLLRNRLLHTCDSPNIYLQGADLHCENPVHGDIAIRAEFGKTDDIGPTTANP